MSTTLVFDVNETLLDLRAMGGRFTAVFGSDDLLAPWFGQLLRNSLVATVTDKYQPFDALAVDALRTVAHGSGLAVDDAVAASIVDEMRRLPAHPDVAPGLAMLKDAGFTAVTLTNSPPRVIADQLDNAGISGYFDRVMSVEPVRRFKPHPATYRFAAEQLDVPVAHLRLVAAHDWDVTGAIRAGARAAFIARRGMRIGAASERPDIVGTDLLDVARRMIAVDQP
jgi:2-haloacid dehalogenase